MRVLALLLLLLTPHAAARQGQPAAGRARVTGTRISIVPPAGFAPAKQFPGYVLEAEGASIMVMEMPGRPEQLLEGLSDEARMKAEGLRLLSKVSLPREGGAAPVLMGFSQTAGGVAFLKWVVLVGDESGTAMVTAAFPAESEGRLSEPLKRSVMSARRENSLEVPRAEGLPYAVAERGALKFARRVGHALIFSRGGVSPTASPEDPLFIVSPSLGPAGADGGKAFAERRVAQTTSLKDFAAFKTEPVTLDGLSGFETVADANDKATGRPMFIYQVILFDGESYYLMQGLAGRAQAAEHLPSFKEMARTFRRE